MRNVGKVVLIRDIIVMFIVVWKVGMLFLYIEVWGFLDNVYVFISCVC